MNLQKDLREFVELLNALNVRFLVVGAFAVAYHGYPRYTSDIDLFVERSAENAERLLEAPNRIDVMTFISGVGFEEAWASRELGQIGELSVPFISKDMLKRNKAASGRSQDLADLERL